MPTMLQSWCQVNNLILRGGLIQNKDPMTLLKAREAVGYALRWRHRLCKTCENEFDISHTGYLYSCGKCSPEV
jgi:hypothetical protein